MEHHDVVDAVEELRAEVRLEFVVDFRLHPLIRGLGVVHPGEAKVLALGDVAGAEVGGHDDHGVLEVHHPTLRVGEPAIFQNLQQRVEDVRVSLLDLIEQHHRERLATHLFGELAALFVPDIAGG